MKISVFLDEGEEFCIGSNLYSDVDADGVNCIDIVEVSMGFQDKFKVCIADVGDDDQDWVTPLPTQEVIEAADNINKAVTELFKPLLASCRKAKTDWQKAHPELEKEWVETHGPDFEERMLTGAW